MSTRAAWSKMVEEVKAKIAEYEAHPGCESVRRGYVRYWAWYDDATAEDVFLVVNPNPGDWWWACGSVGLGYFEHRICALSGTRLQRAELVLDMSYEQRSMLVEEEKERQRSKPDPDDMVEWGGIPMTRAEADRIAESFRL